MLYAYTGQETEENSILSYVNFININHFSLIQLMACEYQLHIDLHLVIYDS